MPAEEGSLRGRSASTGGAVKLKIILLGDSGYVYKRFPPTKPPDYLEVLEREVNDKSAILQILDTSGQSLDASRFNDVKGCMLVYDVNDDASLKSLKNWRNEFNCRVVKKPWDPSTFPFLVVGNKVDLNLNKTSYLSNSQNAKQWCQEQGLLHHRLTSAKDHKTIVDAFQSLAQLVFEHEAKM
ncbi:hypothetical protein GOP47_0010722 [Adiantum capillus-veneris]|uniref:Uncharacterized protein n=1 Tax=Adiantum capillus-veneris TaxID=13818 RepID=A0A9D4UVM7_ADICA|nr:hypothetical protein GOP47_0010722 [Adiantum capillus-veneris]